MPSFNFSFRSNRWLYMWRIGPLMMVFMSSSRNVRLKLIWFLSLQVLCFGTCKWAGDWHTLFSISHLQTELTALLMWGDATEHFQFFFAPLNSMGRRVWLQSSPSEWDSTLKKNNGGHFKLECKRKGCIRSLTLAIKSLRWTGEREIDGGGCMWPLTSKKLATEKTTAWVAKKRMTLQGFFHYFPHKYILLRLFPFLEQDVQ